MPLDAPGVVHVVAFLGESLLDPDILIKPVASLIIGSVGFQPSVVIPAIHQKDTDGLLIALANDVGISVFRREYW